MEKMRPSLNDTTASSWGLLSALSPSLGVACFKLFPLSCAKEIQC